MRIEPSGILLLTIRGDLNICDTDNDKFTGGDLEIEDEVHNDDENGVYRPQDSSVRPFKVPIVNPKCKSYHKMINLSSSVTEPPIIKELSRDQLEKNRKVLLTLKRSYRNQCVERHVKVIMDASSRVVGEERGNGTIRLTFKS